MLKRSQMHQRSALNDHGRHESIGSSSSPTRRVRQSDGPRLVWHLTGVLAARCAPRAQVTAAHGVLSVLVGVRKVHESAPARLFAGGSTRPTCCQLDVPVGAGPTRGTERCNCFQGKHPKMINQVGFIDILSRRIGLCGRGAAALWPGGRGSSRSRSVITWPYFDRAYVPLDGHARLAGRRGAQLSTSPGLPLRRESWPAGRKALRRQERHAYTRRAAWSPVSRGPRLWRNASRTHGPPPHPHSSVALLGTTRTSATKRSQTVSGSSFLQRRPELSRGQVILTRSNAEERPEPWIDDGDPRGRST